MKAERTRRDVCRLFLSKDSPGCGRFSKEQQEQEHQAEEMTGSQPSWSRVRDRVYRGLEVQPGELADFLSKPPQSLCKTFSLMLRLVSCCVLILVFLQTLAFLHVQCAWAGQPRKLLCLMKTCCSTESRSLGVACKCELYKGACERHPLLPWRAIKISTFSVSLCLQRPRLRYRSWAGLSPIMLPTPL